VRRDSIGTRRAGVRLSGCAKRVTLAAATGLGEKVDHPFDAAVIEGRDWDVGSTVRDSQER
jgi:hypothetical protein